MTDHSTNVINKFFVFILIYINRNIVKKNIIAIIRPTT